MVWYLPSVSVSPPTPPNCVHNDIGGNCIVFTGRRMLVTVHVRTAHRVGAARGSKWAIGPKWWDHGPDWTMQ